tara:strand:+ start:690 stop:1886 length:1197 start_codon:yes stop_codon:yes gene_type:complete
MASAPIYCTHKELKRVFPQLDEYDQKTPVYGWTSESQFGTTFYVAYDSGLMTHLFIDGKSQQSGNQTVATAASTAVNNGSGYAADATTIVVDSGSALTNQTYIKIGDEILGITGISTNELTVVRGQLGTNAAAIVDDAPIYKHFQPSAVGDNLYDEDNDFIIYKGSDPNDSLAEVGEDFKGMVTEFRTDASRYLDSRLDPKLPKNMWKDKSGNFDYMIIRTTALYAAAFMVKTKDPTSELATALMTEADNNVQLLNEGRAALSWQNTGDASKGVLRDVSYTDGSVRPVDFRGRAGGVDYDLIKVSISGSAGGAIGTAKYNVYVKDSTGLKTNQVVTEEVITGDYQALAYGLQVRFAGTANNSEATATNEWEVEVRGYNEEVDTGDLKGIKMTRRRHYL